MTLLYKYDDEYVISRYKTGRYFKHEAVRKEQASCCRCERHRYARLGKYKMGFQP